MIRFFCISAAFVLSQFMPLAAQDVSPTYDFRERTRALAFDPVRFFPERSAPEMSVRYLGDDYGFPVYAIAVRRGCTDADRGDARRTCGERLIARMVRAHYEGAPQRPRARGQRLFGIIAQSRPQSDDALVLSLDKAGLEWFEADVRMCPTAMAHFVTGGHLKFSPAFDPASELTSIVLHADTITFEIGDYLARSRYQGWIKPGTPAAWANAFAASLEPCWKPSTALVPWRVAKR